MQKLTRPQTAIYEMDRFGGGAIANIAGDIFFDVPYSADELSAAVACFLDSCAVMHTRIVLENEVPMQYICSEQDEKIPVISFKSRSDYEQWAVRQAQQPVVIFSKLYRFFVVDVCGECGVFGVLHHIIGDAWSMGVIAERLCELLAGRETHQDFTYADYLAAEEVYEKSERFSKDEAYWLESCAANDEMSFLSEKQVQSNLTLRAQFVLTRAESGLIRTYCEENGVSAYVLFLAAAAAYFYRVTAKEKFYIGTPVLNRSTVEEKNTVGTFINTVPLSVGVEGQMSFGKLAEEIGAGVAAVFRHQKYSYSLLLKTLRAQRNRTGVLFDVLLSCQNVKINGGTKVWWYCCGAQMESLQIHIDDRNGDDIFHFAYDYQVEKFTAGEIERMHGHILNLLLGGIAAPDKCIHEIKIMSEAEYNKVIYDFNDTAAEYPRDKCVHELFEEQVQKTPAATAVIACDAALTYAELNEKANRIAHSLMEKGVQPGDIVAFKLLRRSYLLAAVFGILKTGAAYMPLDPDYPQERIDYMLTDSQAVFCVAGNNISELLNNKKCANPSVEVTSVSNCYCIYTSGSTGKPKGTLVKHRGIVNYSDVNNHNAVISHIVDNNLTTIVSTTTVVFDIFTTESILPLVNGLKVVLADETQSSFQENLNELMRESPADVLQTTPTKMKILSANHEQIDYLRSLKVIILIGEVLDISLYDKLNKITTAHIFNAYGPTEATVWVTNTEVSITDITIGKPIANTQVYILDKHLQPVPIGVVGELCIAGDCVGAGYLNRPELTAEKFIADPFGSGIMYKTGDLARWREDGNIEYIGRNDFQVKIRGLRIELGEIENAICSVAGVSQAVVVVRQDSSGRQLICAFYTAAGKAPDRYVIREQIAQKLPQYMLPHIFTQMETMPLTASGKLNRSALPDIDLEHIMSDTAYAAPVTAAEKKLCAIIAAVLNVEKVGLNDDFFDLGGDSLKAIEFVAAAHAQGICFSLQNVFDNPTVKRLSDYLQNEDKQQVDYQPGDFAAIDKLIAVNADADFAPERIEVGDILLAGATGFLGMHILAEFLETESGTAFCLVRGRDEAEAQTRLAELLQYYFDGQYLNLIGTRIVVLCGDVQQENLGLKILPGVQTVINAAANVKHYGSYQYFYDANVQSVKNLLACTRQVGARFLHISTLSVSGNSFAEEFDSYRSAVTKHFGEHNLYIGQPLANVYARSKFEAEKLILTEMACGLPANIFRMGNLTNRASDGRFQYNYDTNAFARRLKGIIELGKCPDYLLQHYVEFTPVDEAAKAILTAARYFNLRQTIFHINSPRVLYIDRLLQLFGQCGIKVDLISGNEFTALFRNAAQESNTAYLWETFINDLDENDQLNYDSNIHIDNDVTVAYLSRLGFAWGEIGEEYIRQYAAWFLKAGYWRQT